MSIMSPPSPPQPKPTVRTTLATEWDRFEEMSTTRLLLLVLPSILLLVVDPLVPILAYLLQVWAGSPGYWRERWAGLMVQAKQSGIVLAALALYLLLDHTQVWLVPTITFHLQLFWQTHLPGTLSLSLLDGRDLLARSFLLLPLAPIVAIYYERIDPRTSGGLKRVLMPNDLKPKPQPQTPPPPSTPAPPRKATTPKNATPKATTPKDATTAHQITIESFLATDPVKEKTRGTSSPTQPTTNGPAPNGLGQKTVKKNIDWDDLQE